MITYIEKKFKSTLNVRKSINHWFWDKYGINPYNGCQFGCIYCDSRSAKYNLPVDFENKIIIKKDLNKMLDKRLTNARTLLQDVIGIGGTTDPYQPAESKYKNTRKCLEVIKNHGYPVHIATKSSLVLRDIDLIEEIGKRSWATVSVTITTVDKQIANFLETKVTLPDIRFNIIKEIKEKTKHIQAGILFMPVVPFLCDNEENIKEIVKRAKEHKADYVLFGPGMTMRDMQALWFLKHLKERYPDLVSEYEKLYNFKYNNSEYKGSYEPHPSYYQKPTELFIKYAKQYGVRRRIKRFIPEDYRKYNYKISEKLFEVSYERQITGRHWDAYFWAAYNIQNLKESIINIAKRNELKKIRGVGDKISAYIIEILEKIS